MGNHISIIHYATCEQTLNVHMLYEDHYLTVEHTRELMISFKVPTSRVISSSDVLVRKSPEISIVQTHQYCNAAC
jgi:hypothetical protein